MKPQRHFPHIFRATERGPSIIHPTAVSPAVRNLVFSILAGLLGFVLGALAVFAINPTR